MQEFEKYFIREKELFKNPKAFEVDYRPEKIVITREIKELIREVSSFIKYRIPHHLFVVGSNGSGKTLASLYTIANLNKMVEEKKLADNFIPLYINCRNKTAGDILTNIYRKEIPQTLPEHDHIITFIQHTNNVIKKDIIIFLDEVDKGKRLNELLYKLSRPKEFIPELEFSINLVLISNDLKWEDSLDDAVRSSLNLKRIDFKNYSNHQLEQILNERAEMGLKEGVMPRKILNLIADKVAKQHRGDSRVAIATLKRLIQYAEGKKLEKITEKEVIYNLPKVVEEFEIKSLSKLDKSQFFTLYACYALKFHPTVLKIWEDYISLVERKHYPEIGKSKFYKNIDYLESHGFIETKQKIVNGQLGGTQRAVKVLFSEKSIEEEYQKRIYKL